MALDIASKDPVGLNRALVNGNQLPPENRIQALSTPLPPCLAPTASNKLKKNQLTQLYRHRKLDWKQQ
jgi:hypothetical protein